MKPRFRMEDEDDRIVEAPLQRKNIVCTTGSSILFPSNNEMSHDIEFECRPKLFTGLLRLRGRIPCTWMKVKVDLNLSGPNAPTLRLQRIATNRIQVIPVGSCEVNKNVSNRTISVITKRGRRTLIFECPNDYEQHYWERVLQKYANATTTTTITTTNK